MIVPFAQVDVVERTWTELVGWVVALSNTPLVTIGGTPVSLWTLVLVGVFLIATIWLSSVIQRGIDRTMRARTDGDPGTIAVAKRLAHYLILILGFGIALQTVGIELTALFAAGAIVAVGVGLAMQDLSKNFVSGVILLFERTIKPGDILEVDGKVVRVLEMRIRSALARTRDDEDILIPNSLLVESIIKNYTHLDPSYRVRGRVGVAYGSDPQRVMAALVAAGRDVEGRNEEKEPVALFLEFGSSSLNFEVSIWTEEPWTGRRMLSSLNLAIAARLAEAGITVAFPQLDIHLSEQVERGLAQVR